MSIWIQNSWFPKTQIHHVSCSFLSVKEHLVALAPCRRPIVSGDKVRVLAFTLLNWPFFFHISGQLFSILVAHQDLFMTRTSALFLKFPGKCQQHPTLSTTNLSVHQSRFLSITGSFYQSIFKVISVIIMLWTYNYDLCFNSRVR